MSGPHTDGDCVGANDGGSVLSPELSLSLVNSCDVVAATVVVTSVGVGVGDADGGSVLSPELSLSLVNSCDVVAAIVVVTSVGVGVGALVVGVDVEVSHTTPQHDVAHCTKIKF